MRKAESLGVALASAPWWRIVSAKLIMRRFLWITGSIGFLAQLGMAVENRRQDSAPGIFQMSREAGFKGRRQARIGAGSSAPSSRWLILWLARPVGPDFSCLDDLACASSWREPPSHAAHSRNACSGWVFRRGAQRNPPPPTGPPLPAA